MNFFIYYVFTLQSYGKTREKPNLFVLFRVQSNFGVAKVTKSREQNKRSYSFSFICYMLRNRWSLYKKPMVLRIVTNGSLYSDFLGITKLNLE